MKRKEKSVAYLLWFFLGLLGGHRFYLGHVGVGLLQLFTAGGFGIWWLIDAFTLGSKVDLYNYRHGVNAFGNVNNNQNNNNNNIVVNVVNKQD